LVDFNELEQKYTKAFSKIVFNENVPKGSISIEEILKKNKAADPQKIIRKLKDIIEARVYSTVYYYALVQYRMMEVSGEWTEAGKDRVKTAYMYLLLNISLDKDFSMADYDKFDAKIAEEYKRYELIGLNKDQLSKIMDYPEITILGEVFRQNQTKDINNILKAVSSPRRIIMGSTGESKSIIFGAVDHIEYMKYDLYYIHKEDIRTPNCVHYIVAVIEDDQIAVREEVCKYIFLKKWKTVSEGDLFFMNYMSSMPEHSIAESIKKRTVDCFMIDRDNTLEESQQDFVNLMKENFVWHELAHDALEDTDINDMELAIVDGLTTVKENFLSVLQEVMVEWYPEHNGVKGPLKNIVDTALKQDKNKADVMLNMYLSDAWFLDTDTKFMFPYTYIMFALIQPFIEEDGQFDYTKMYAEFTKVYKFLADWYKETLSDIYVQLKKISYTDNGKKKSYVDLEKDINQMMDLYEKKVIKKERTEKKRIGNFWINFFTQLKMKDISSLNSVFTYLEDREKQLYETLKTMFINDEKGEYSNKEIKECILDSMQKKGFRLEL